MPSSLIDGCIMLCACGCGYALSPSRWLQASKHYGAMQQLAESAMPAEEAAEEIYAGLVKGEVGRAELSVASPTPAAVTQPAGDWLPALPALAWLSVVSRIGH